MRMVGGSSFRWNDILLGEIEEIPAFAGIWVELLLSSHKPSQKDQWYL